jgi:hypothetical protein
MTDLEAILLIEGDNTATREEQIAAWQALIDSGIVWRLQGTYARGALALIESGECYARPQK